MCNNFYHSNGAAKIGEMKNASPLVMMTKSCKHFGMILTMM